MHLKPPRDFLRLKSYALKSYWLCKKCEAMSQREGGLDWLLD